MKEIVFQHRRGPGSHDIYEEVIEMDDDATEEEINKEFYTWVWERVIGDSVTWYEN